MRVGRVPAVDAMMMVWGSGVQQEEKGVDEGISKSPKCQVRLALLQQQQAK